MTCSPASFCDFLDVTYSPVDCPYPELSLLLLGAGFIGVAFLNSLTWRRKNGDAAD